MGRKIAFCAPPYMNVHRELLSKETVERLRAFAVWVLSNRPPPEGDVDEIDWSKSLSKAIGEGLLRHPGQLLGFLSDSPLTKICRSVLGHDLVYILNTTFVRSFEPKRRSVPTPMHFDAHIYGAPVRMLTAWIPLNDVGKKSPGLTISSRPHWPLTHWDNMVQAVNEEGLHEPGPDFVRGHPPQEILELSEQEAAPPLQTPILYSGDLILFDHQHIHGTQSTLENPERRVSIEIRFMPTSEAVKQVKRGSKEIFVKL